jgi:hypothetical protein
MLTRAKTIRIAEARDSDAMSISPSWQRGPFRSSVVLAQKQNPERK